MRVGLIDQAVHEAVLSEPPDVRATHIAGQWGLGHIICTACAGNEGQHQRSG